MARLSEILAVHRSQLGYTEGGNGTNNDTKYGAWYGLNPGAWCDMYVSWCASKVAGGVAISGKFAYTPSHAAWFQSRGQWGHTPKPGALVFFEWAGGTRISHVGIVESVRSDGRFVTIEGNVGGQVQRLVRSMTYVVGFGYPAYEPELPVPATPPAPKPVRYVQSLWNLGLRVGPDMKAPAIAGVHTVPKGARCRYLGTERTGRFIKLAYSGKIGWAEGRAFRSVV